MQFYLYSCQDLTICSSSNINIEAGNIFKLKFEQAETIFIYPTSSSGVVMINEQILATQLHTHIIFHRLNDNAILCEIKPFVLNESIKQYAINGGIIKLIENIGCTYIYHNNNYYGVIKDSCKNIGFEKKEKNAREYGVLRF
ncbi:MAG: hypothetical protein J6Q15_02675, partial [Clostridia bacterium]|nr:hypothetical protein [Clostridia bacterium]